MHVLALSPSPALPTLATPAAAPVPSLLPGIADAYWEYRLKPWDMAAGVLIVEEAGGSVTTMDGRAFSGAQCAVCRLDLLPACLAAGCCCRP